MDEQKKSGVVYISTYNQIKQLIEMGQQDLAKELAYSAFTLLFEGKIEDKMCQVLLAGMSEINQSNNEKYQKKVVSAKEADIKKNRLDEIAELVNKGLTQKEIAEKLNLSQQIVSYRVKKIRESYGELLTKNFQDFTKNTKNTNDTNTNVNVNVNVNVNEDVDVNDVPPFDTSSVGLEETTLKFDF